VMYEVVAGRRRRAAVVRLAALITVRFITSPFCAFGLDMRFQLCG
jgi:hypothetical protein